MNDPIVVFTGGFDPIHSGHIECINQAREIGRVIIGLNSDAWLARKKGRPFMPFEERLTVLKQFKQVMAVIAFDDADGSACDAIRQAKAMFPNDRIIFVNGGDRTDKNIPEMDQFLDDPRVEFRFGIGGEHKANSSSWILEEWKAPKTLRPWGYYRVLHEPNTHVKLKELTVNPGQRLSMQQHSQRNEFWFVSQGRATVYTLDSENKIVLKSIYQEHESLYIPVDEWHQLCNDHPEPLKLIEIQYGQTCVEDDIIRF